MKTKHILLITLSTLTMLTSCNTTFQSKYYLSYIGRMFITNIKEEYSSISDIKIVDKVTNTNKEYYAKENKFYTKEELKEFYDQHTSILTTRETNIINQNELSYFYLYYQIQIPKGYTAYKRENIQANINNTSEQVLITDNLYYYASNQDILYCEIDLKDDKEKVESIFTFYFEIYKDNENILKNSKTRIIYHLS